MKRSRFKLAAATIGLVAGLTVAAGVYALTSSQSSGRDPCDGRSDAECAALIREADAGFRARFKEWLAQFNNTDFDLRSLPIAPGQVLFPEPAPDLAASVSSADVILVGTTKTVMFDGAFQAHVSIAINQSIKGTLVGQVTVLQPGGPEPYPDWSTAVLVVNDADPLLLPGDRAVLLLDRHDETGAYELQPWTGRYLIGGDNKLTPLEGNPFAVEVDGKTLDEFLVTIESIVGAQAPP